MQNNCNYYVAKKKIASQCNAMQWFEWKTTSKNLYNLVGILGTVRHMTHWSQNK